MTAEIPWRRLETASLLVNLIPDVWRTVRVMWLPFLVIFLGRPSGQGVDFFLPFLFFALSFGRTAAHVLTLRYRVREGRLEIQSGILARSHRVIDPGRIQNLGIVQNLFHKAAGLVELRVETAGERGTEGLLSAITVAEAERLRSELAVRTAEAPSGDSVREITLAELVAYGVSTGRVGAVLVGIAVFVEVATPLFPEWAGQVMGRPGFLLGLGLAGMAGSYVLGVMGAVVRWYGYRLVRTGRGVAAEAGLFTRRRVEVPISKVQVVRIDESVLRRWMGYATLRVDTAAGFSPEDPGGSELTVPMVPREEVGDVLRQLIPRGVGDVFSARFQPAAPRALMRRLFAATVRWAALSALLAFGVHRLSGFSVPWLGVVLAVPLVSWGLVTNWLAWRYEGWAWAGQLLAIREGWLRRETAVVPIDRIQSVHFFQGPWMRANSLARVEVWGNGVRLDVPDQRQADARALFDRLRLRLVDQQAHGPRGDQRPGHVGGQATDDRVPDPGHPDGSEVDGQHVEGGLGGALDGGGHGAGVAVGPEGGGHLGGERHGAGPGEGPEQGQREDLRGEPDPGAHGGDGAGQPVHGAAGPEHAHHGEDADQVRDDPGRR